MPMGAETEKTDVAPKSFSFSAPKVMHLFQSGCF